MAFYRSIGNKSEIVYNQVLVDINHFAEEIHLPLKRPKCRCHWLQATNKNWGRLIPSFIKEDA